MSERGDEATVTLAVSNLTVAAAMLAESDQYILAGATLDGRPGFYVFHVELPASQQQRAYEIVEACSPGRRNRMDMMVHLGRYERGFKALKRAMHALDQGQRKDGVR